MWTPHVAPQLAHVPTEASLYRVGARAATSNPPKRLAPHLHLLHHCLRARQVAALAAHVNDGVVRDGIRPD